jgi:hypothetical protein
VIATSIKAKPYKKAGQKAAPALKAKKARPARPAAAPPDLMTLPEAELANLEARQKRLSVAQAL